MKAVIMAGGEGSRLRPLTCNVPKPMMPVLEKPVMQYAVELLKKYGITDIAVTLQYLPDEVISYFIDGEDFGVNIKYFIEEFPLGTAGSVKNGEKFLDDTFIVISGDALTDIDLSKAVDFHRKKGAIATLILKEVPVPLEYGVVVTDKDGKINSFLEKPSWGEVFSDKANTGIYILEPEIFSYYERDQKFDFSNDLFPILLQKNKPVYGYLAEGYWCDIGNLEQYMRCQFDMIKGFVKADIKGEKYEEGIWIGDNCEVSPTANIESPAFIGSGCKLYSGANVGSFSIIGKSNILSSGVKIKRSVLLNNCYVGSGAHIKGAVVGNNVQLEAKVCVYEDCTIGDGTLVGEKAVIKPGVRIWPSKEIEPSAVVKENVIWAGKLSKSLFGKSGINGEVNVDITPEFVSKIGSAYGSILKPDSKVAISCGDNGAAQMFKYSLATGLLSMGVEVYDLNKMAVPMTRFAVLFFGVQGAIHVSIDYDDPQKISIRFMDANGCDIDKPTERKIENSFIREDFRRVKTDAFKRIVHLSDCMEHYTRQVINKVRVHNIRSRKYKLILSARNPILLSAVHNLLAELRINIRLYSVYNDFIGLSKEVAESGADLGLYVSDEGESAVIVDEKGNLIKDNLYEALNALTLLNSTELKTLAVPITSSEVMEEVAKKCGAKFVKTKTTQKSILDTYIKNEKRLSRREIVDAYLTSLDAIGMCIYILNIMAERNKPLSAIMADIPRYYYKKQDIRCPWNMKGKVMRDLIEKNSSQSVDLIEGVKLNFNNGWVLVLPDSEEPLCKVYTEARNLEALETLSEEFRRKIESITQFSKEELA